MQVLVDKLSETWANLPADESGDDIALAYLCAAYGCGYMAGLDDRQDLSEPS